MGKACPTLCRARAPAAPGVPTIDCGPDTYGARPIPPDQPQLKFKLRCGGALNPDDSSAIVWELL